MIDDENMEIEQEAENSKAEKEAAEAEKETSEQEIEIVETDSSDVAAKKEATEPEVEVDDETDIEPEEQEIVDEDTEEESAETGIEEEKVEVEDEPEEVKISKALKHFNWGAFGFTWLWGLGNGSFGKTWHILVLDIMSAVAASKYGLIILAFAFILRIFYGVNGNKWAFERRSWYSIEDYTNTQRSWAKFFGLLFSLFILFFVAGLLFVFSFIASKH